jgi:hypothetical protein
MKSILLLIAIFFITNILLSQNNVGIGTPAPDASAILDLKTLHQGFLMPRIINPLTDITSPANGLMAYHLGDSSLYTYRSLSGWKRSGFELPYSASSTTVVPTQNSVLHMNYNGPQTNYYAIKGESFYSTGILGQSQKNIGVLGSSAEHDGISGITNGLIIGSNGVRGTGYGNAKGVYGYSLNQDGVYGESSGVDGIGVNGYATGMNGIGVQGKSSATSGIGVYGETNNIQSIGVSGKALADYSHGLRGEANGVSGHGLQVFASGLNGFGINAHSAQSKAIQALGWTIGVHGVGRTEGIKGEGILPNAIGVKGICDSLGGIGIQGLANKGIGVQGSSDSIGVQGTGTNIGVNGESYAIDGIGVRGYSILSNGKGVYGEANGIGVEGKSLSFIGVKGTGNIGVEGNSPFSNGIGLKGEANTNGGIGVSGMSNFSNGYGVQGTSTNIGVQGTGWAAGIEGNSNSNLGVGGIFNGYGSASSGIKATLFNTSGKAAAHLVTNSGSNVHLLLEETEDDYTRIDFKNTNSERWAMGALPKDNNNSANAKISFYYSDLDNGTGGDALILEGNGNLILPAGDAYKPGGGPWIATSDSRLKNNINNYNDGLAIINEIEPKTYTYNSKSGYSTDITHIGVIAQDLEKIAPYMIEKNKEGYLQVDPNAFTYMLINAVKELSAENEKLKSSNIDMSTRLVRIESMLGIKASASKK